MCIKRLAYYITFQLNILVSGMHCRPMNLMQCDEDKILSS
uniref:Uncharacterized protein n=1 Tax=Rhizophora mucronata TaxID=61149 RepID=A0A2P2PV92_RHIMU